MERSGPQGAPSHLRQEEHEVAHGVDCGHTQSVFHQDDEGVTSRRAETGAVDGGSCICILGNRSRRRTSGGAGGGAEGGAGRRRGSKRKKKKME